MLPRICYQLRFSNKNYRNLMIIRIGEITCGCTKERFYLSFFVCYPFIKRHKKVKSLFHLSKEIRTFVENYKERIWQGTKDLSGRTNRLDY